MSVILRTPHGRGGVLHSLFGATRSHMVAADAYVDLNSLWFSCHWLSKSMAPFEIVRGRTHGFYGNVILLPCGD
jgi:hypothetical protein